MRSGFKRRAPRAIVAIKKFAQKQMGTSDVRVDQGLNKAIWSNGVKAVARRVRVRVARCAATPGLGGADRGEGFAFQIVAWRARALGCARSRREARRAWRWVLSGFWRAPTAAADGPVVVRRKRNDDEDAQEEFYTLVTHVPVVPGGYKGLETKPAEED